MEAGCPSEGCDADDEPACADGACARFAVCPADLQSNFSSIEAQVFMKTCGTDGSACHSSAGALDSGGLDLVTDPYRALLGSDGKGALATNLVGSVRGLRRVLPGDPDNSYLLIKLMTQLPNDEKYGSGMPCTTPGSVCPPAIDAIRAWIVQGATKN